MATAKIFIVKCVTVLPMLNDFQENSTNDLFTYIEQTSLFMRL